MSKHCVCCGAPAKDSRLCPECRAIGLLRRKGDIVCHDAAARIVEMEKKIAELMADLQERDQALHVESEALGYADDRSERMEKALDRACEFLKVTIFACPPEDNWGIERKGCDWDDCDKCWKKYFLEGDSDA